MLDLAIFNDSYIPGIATIETNHGEELQAPDWPCDCDFQMVAFRPSEGTCGVVSAGELAYDIGKAVQWLHATGAFKHEKPDWFERLELYSAGASSMSREPAN